MKPTTNSPAKERRQVPGAGITLQAQGQPASDIPDVATLTYLAAQPKFAHLPPEQAVAEALKLWKQSQAAMGGEVTRLTRRRQAEDAVRRYLGIPMPKQWPATLADFYQAVVRGKDETENQPRFKRFLRYQVEAEQEGLRQEIKRELARVPKHERKEKRTLSVLNTLRMKRLRTKEAVEAEVERRFTHHKAYRFKPNALHPALPSEWTCLASHYQEWWEAERREARVRAGRARAQAYKARKMVSENQASTNLAAAIAGPEGATSAAKAKKTVARLRKEQLGS